MTILQAPRSPLCQHILRGRRKGRRQLVALTRVTSSEYRHPALGYVQAKSIDERVK